MSIKAVIDVARSYLAVTEDPPGSNRTIFGAEFGLDGQPWCVMFLWYCFQHAGERMAFFGGGKTASCSMLLRWYKEQGLTMPASEVQKGDIVLLNFHGGKDPEHCGLVESVARTPTPAALVAVNTIEGNTSPSDGSQSNGGMVCAKTRYPSQIVGVCRPQYKPEEPEIADDVTGHWAKASIEWAKEKGLIKGYPDGSFKPNQAITRAEACVMLERFYALLWEDDLR